MQIISACKFNNKSRKYEFYENKKASLLNLLFIKKLRRQDSNMRPPGYEPGELPTAPLRDIINQLGLVP